MAGLDFYYFNIFLKAYLKRRSAGVKDLFGEQVSPVNS